MKKAVILLSGGLDSTTCLAIAKSQNYQLHALSFSYGQRHEIELEFAKKIAKQYQVKSHKIAQIDLRLFGGSALTDNIEVPKNRQINQDEIPTTYVPARNLIFLSFATAFAETINANHIFLGVNQLDYSGYPDCRQNFINSFQKTANLATKAATLGQNFQIHTPLINLTKTQIIKQGLALGLDYSQTHSCYDPIIKNKHPTPCQKCDSCILRQEAFTQLNLTDPLLITTS